mgnify:CR=1 FL=1|jgi:hypothetical protein|tara:strand:+ start:149 stop:463 length:315 start_codon:yes stop_codon:yes gene_type:complete
MLISLDEKIREEELLRLWLKEDDRDALLTEEELQELIKTPPKLCSVPNDCASRYLSGNACICIRSIFKNHKQFIQFQSAFEQDFRDKFLLGGIEIIETKPDKKI